MSQLSLQLCCLRRQSRYLGPQLLHFLALLGLSHQDLLRSHLHISILAHPALSLSPCLMEGDVSMLPGVATNVATEGWGVQPVDKTVAEHSGVDGVRLRCVQLGGQHQQVLRVSPIPCCRPWNEVSRAERPRWSPKVAARTAQTWAAVSASPAARVSTSLRADPSKAWISHSTAVPSSILKFRRMRSAS